MTVEERRLRGVVLEVLWEALRNREMEGLVIAAPPSPERSLLTRWLEGELTVEIPDPSTVRAVGDATGDSGEGAWAAAGIARGARRGLLPVHPAGKARLLLDVVPRVPCYPLGDFWSQELRTYGGDVTLPAVLAGLSREAADRAEDALRAGLDGGLGVDRAMAGLHPGTARSIRTALRAGRALGRPPIVPKTGSWTLGIDPLP